MTNISNLSHKQILIIAIVSIIVLGTIGIYFYKNILNKDEEYEYIDDYDEVIENSESKNEDEIEEKIMIHITGCVKNQGIVILNDGDRIIDAIEIAGGATEEADLNKINLAYELQDGEKIYIPSKEDEEEKNYVSSNSNTESKNGKVNINKATKEQLQSLSGIGESTANKIIQYRKENGNFNKIEDLKNVPGIGDSKFEAIKDSITVK